jgi:hypothetical protein
VIALHAAELAIVFEEPGSVNVKRSPAQRAMLVEAACSRVLIVPAHFGSYSKPKTHLLWTSILALQEVKPTRADLNDPAYFEEMSALLDEIIKARKAKAIEYEQYLRQIAALANRVDAGHSDETPKMLDTPGKRLSLWRTTVASTKRDRPPHP